MIMAEVDPEDPYPSPYALPLTLPLPLLYCDPTQA